MTYFIIKKTRREREADLAESRHRSGDKSIDGVVRSYEEAAEMTRQREREGIPFVNYMAVSPDSADGKRKHEKDMLQVGVDPETMQQMHSASTRHDVDHSHDIIGKKADGSPLRVSDLAR